MTPETLHGKHGLLLGLALAGVIPYGLPAISSLLAGGGIQALNLGVLQREVRRLLGLSGSAPGALGIALNLARFLLLLAAVLWVLAQPGVQPLAFGLGLMLGLPAAAWQGLHEARRGN
jgi:hypothetical protein